jgi:prepilin-type N-terminal cleavage/methylation domain-containing protein
MKNKIMRGFTLIELLVVIAIIGILSAVVLASLNTARSKGNDVGVKANLNTVGTQAALFVSENDNTYGTFSIGECPSPNTSGTTVFHNATIESAIAAAVIDSSGGSATCASTNTAYAVAVSRPADIAADTSNYWCVDSAGSHCGINTNISGTSCGTCLTSQ